MKSYIDTFTEAAGSLFKEQPSFETTPETVSYKDLISLKM